MVNLLLGSFVYTMSAAETRASGTKDSGPSDVFEGMMIRSDVSFSGGRKPAAAQGNRLRSAPTVYPRRH